MAAKGSNSADVQNTRELAHQETIVDPVAAALRNAPLDDEPETEEDKLAAAVAREWLRKNGGRGIPHAEAMRRLGLD